MEKETLLFGRVWKKGGPRFYLVFISSRQVDKMLAVVSGGIDGFRYISYALPLSLQSWKSKTRNIIVRA
jgi:hypothetical protein